MISWALLLEQSQVFDFDQDMFLLSHAIFVVTLSYWKVVGLTPGFRAQYPTHGLQQVDVSLHRLI